MMKKYFITGLMVWVPLVITLFFLRIIVNIGDKFLVVLPASFNPVEWLGISLPGFGLLVLCVMVFITGIFATNVLGKQLVSTSESLLARVPLVRSIYYGVKRTLQVFFTTNKAFRQVVLVEYPRKDCWSLAFVTDQSPTQDLFDDAMVTLFIPTTPNPTSGYILVVPNSELKYLDMSIDDAIQFVISLGTACALKELSSQGKIKS